MVENTSPIINDQNLTFQPNETAMVSTTDNTTNFGNSRLSRSTSVIKATTSQPWKKIAAIVGGVLLVLLVIGGIIGFYTYSTVRTLQAQANEAEILVQVAYDAFKAQNLPTTQQSLRDLQAKAGEIKQTYTRLSFYQAVPIARNYYLDGTHALKAAESGLSAGLKSIDALTPYADVLGFSGEGAFTGGTAEDRLKIVLETIDKISPILDTISADLEITRDELNKIDPNRYPEDFQGQPLRSYISQAQIGINGAVTALTDYRPVIEQLPSIAGGSEGGRKKYLVLFQNDNELRPTGGFLTAFSVVILENGKVTPEKSDDIYELDKKFTKRLPIPEALGRYLTSETRWNLRDMNTSPDFKVSMDQFLENYRTLGGEAQDIDGIIAVDTHVLTELLTTLGPVNIPGFGTFSAENDPSCDCPQVVKALSEIITRPVNYVKVDRKGILGPMMREILNKAYAAPKQQWPLLVEQGLKQIGGRHIQIYLFDEKAQAAAETINAAGRLKAEVNADFLAIVNANLGGAKSNLFINYDVVQTVSAPENGKITKTVEITYKNNRRGDNCNLEAGLLCLNSTLRDWTRLYVPAGAELVEAQGFTNEPRTYEEQGFQVFDGFFILEPNSQAKLRLTYTVPYADEKEYRIKLWKQGGVSAFETLLDINDSQEKVLVDTDKVVKVAF